jgi:hypothetical protein
MRGVLLFRLPRSGVYPQWQELGPDPPVDFYLVPENLRLLLTDRQHTSEAIISGHLFLHLGFAFLPFTEPVLRNRKETHTRQHQSVLFPIGCNVSDTHPSNTVEH